MKNLLSLPVPKVGEFFETLLCNDHVTIETIVSSDTPEPKLYDQPHDEAVLLIEGEATLEANGNTIVLKAGDFLHIPAHTPHKVSKTKNGTRWLAIHAKEPLC